MSSFKKSTRREFLVAGSSAALAAAASAANAATEQAATAIPAHTEAADGPEILFGHADQRTFSGDTATQIAMPWEELEPARSA